MPISRYLADARKIWRKFRFLKAASVDSVETPLGSILRSQFDSEWYLGAYPDVASAGIDPWGHYLTHGMREGRLPFFNRALIWDFHLWCGIHTVMVPRLRALLASPEAADQERSYAAWVLGRWYAGQGEWLEAVQVLEPIISTSQPCPGHCGPWLLYLEALIRTEQTGELEKALAELANRFPRTPDRFLAHINCLSGSAFWGANDSSLGDRDALKLAELNGMYELEGLAPVSVKAGVELSIDSLVSESTVPVEGVESSLSVSVIVPTYNAEATLTTALASLCAQSWRNIEILVVDDASTDGTQAVVEQFVASACLRPGLRIQLLTHEHNQGAYAARNTGLKHATGDFITVHDSDDWSHPQKLAIQASALVENPRKLGCFSHWVRTRPELYFGHWRPEEGWTYLNVSSLMFRRKALDTLGYWDRVSFGGDTEYYQRIEAAFGREALFEVVPGMPLSFGRVEANSLTQAKGSHVSSALYGVRKQYQDSARRWHQAAKRPEQLYVAFDSKERPFAGPSAVYRAEKPAGFVHPMDVMRDSGLFDGVWYLQRYSDLQDQLVDAEDHFWQLGDNQGRDPGPNFNTSGYRAAYPDAAEAGEPALWHYVAKGKARGFQARSIFTGEQVWRESAPVVMVCAHQAGAQLFGAERSLLELLDGFGALKVNVLVTLPEALNEEYLSLVRARAGHVAVLPYGWWHSNAEPCDQTIKHFETLIQRFSIDAVYTNTLVLNEPLLAARARKVPAIVHVREVPELDPALCERLGAAPKRIVEHLGGAADQFVVNSAFTGNALQGLPFAVVPNIVKPELFEAVSTPRHPVPTLAMISSNLPKKGLHDFVALARLLEERKVPVRCVLIGPENRYTAELRQEHKGLPSNLVFGGYAQSPQEALSQADIVMNLSHVQESFGRTVLEAMAAGRPVVCYRWGALGELVDDGETGYLVPLGDIEFLADRVCDLVERPELREQFGTAGQQKAKRLYSPKALVGALHQVLRKVGVAVDGVG